MPPAPRPIFYPTSTDTLLDLDNYEFEATSSPPFDLSEDVILVTEAVSPNSKEPVVSADSMEESTGMNACYLVFLCDLIIDMEKETPTQYLYQSGQTSVEVSHPSRLVLV